MAENKRVGPCHVFIGDPTTASGADMQYMGYTRGEVTVNLQIGVSMGRVDQLGQTPQADSIYTIGPRPVASLPLIDEEKVKLEKVLPGATVTGSALGFGSGFSKIADGDIDTLALIPVDETDQGTNGIDAPNAIWFPAVIATDFGQLVFNLPEGDDAFNPHEVQVASLFRESDQGSNNIDDEARAGFIGSPNEFTDLASAGWSLPAATP